MKKYLCVARKIAYLRRRLGLSQKDFAHLIGISPSYLAKIECAQGIRGLSFEVLRSIAEGLEIPLNKLLLITEQDSLLASAYQRKHHANTLSLAEKPLLYNHFKT